MSSGSVFLTYSRLGAKNSVSPYIISLEKIVCPNINSNMEMNKNYLLHS